MNNISSFTWPLTSDRWSWLTFSASSSIHFKLKALLIAAGHFCTNKAFIVKHWETVGNTDFVFLRACVALTNAAFLAVRDRVSPPSVFSFLWGQEVMRRLMTCETMRKLNSVAVCRDVWLHTLNWTERECVCFSMQQEVKHTHTAAAFNTYTQFVHMRTKKLYLTRLVWQEDRRVWVQGSAQMNPTSSASFCGSFTWDTRREETRTLRMVQG